MHREIVHPDDKGRDVDGEDPEHEYEDAMRVVVKVKVRGEVLCYVSYHANVQGQAVTHGVAS